MKKEGANKWDIYYIYGTSSGYIQQYSTSTSDFFRPRPPASDEKNPRSRGYIVGYSPPKCHIYITYIYIYKYIYLYIYIYYICNIYMVFPRTICNNIAPQPRIFFVLVLTRKKHIYNIYIPFVFA